MCIQIGLKNITVLILLGFVECALKINAFSVTGTMSLESLCCHPGVGVGVGIRGSTMFKFSNMCIVF